MLAGTGDDGTPPVEPGVDSLSGVLVGKGDDGTSVVDTSEV